MYALGAMAPAAPNAVPALARALADPSVLVSSHAAGALAGALERAGRADEAGQVRAAVGVPVTAPTGR